MRVQGWALLLALAVGCVTRPPMLGEPPPVIRDVRAEQGYQAVLARYSDSEELYNGFDTVLFAAATLQTPAFREARVRRMALFQSLAAPRVEELLAQEHEAATRAHEFFLGVHVTNPRYEDFDRASSIWNMVLVTPTAEVRPSLVKRIGRVTQDMRATYPYLGVFWVAYRLQFPTTLADGTPTIPPGTERVLLRMASALGRVEMRVSTH